MYCSNAGINKLFCYYTLFTMFVAESDWFDNNN